MPDDIDRQLADRLRAYESSVPADLEPGPARRRRPAAWLLAGAGASVVAATILGIALLTSDPDPVGEASPTPSPSASASAPATSASQVPTPVPTPAESSVPSSTPDGEPSATAGTPSGPIARWAPTGAFASDGWAEEARGIAYAAGHFVAIGYREPDDQRGIVGPPVDEPRIWISADGRAWSQVELGPEFADAHLWSVVALPDGAAMIYGSIESQDIQYTSAAWRSVDGTAWARVDLERPSHDVPRRVVAGGRGYLADVTVTGGTELWHSVDGVAWRSVRSIPFAQETRQAGVIDIGAGPEGFVVTGDYGPVDGGPRYASFVLASGDGVTWFEAESAATPTSSSLSVAPVGGDWITVGTRLPREPEVTADAWFSANGLGWDRRGNATIPLPTVPVDWEGVATFPWRLVSTGERVFLVGLTSVCCHGPAWAASVFSTFDGTSWERLGFPAGTVVTAAAEHDGVVVLAGFDRARPEDGFTARATFWIGERD